MRNKATLTLLEQAVMLLVFALAAALCLRVFLWSNRTSEETAALDRAVLECQNAAETLKVCGRSGGDMGQVLTAASDRMGGSMEQGLWYINYNEDWKQVSSLDNDIAYVLCAQGIPADGVQKARVSVDDGTDTLFVLTVAWQEVAP